MKLDFDKMNGLIPAIIQDNNTHKVLMLDFMNKDAYEETLKTGKVTFFSHTKGRLWTKGEESGNFLNVISIKSDCDNDTLLILVNPVETVIEATNGTDERLIYEGSDLLYHLIVLLTSKGYRIEDLAYELRERHNITWTKH